ncbi:MAG: hypothetical protein QM783_10065 [Phycisphaerales bacterium]
MNTNGFTFTNTGGMETRTGFNKFLTGTVVNSAAGAWAFTEGNFYLSPSSPAVTTLTNIGTVSHSGNTSVTRNGGARAEGRLVNSGTWTASGTGGTIQSLSVTSNSGTWSAASGATLAISDCELSGVFFGLFTGDGVLGGAMALSGDTTFTTVGASVKPWQWTSASIDANGFTLTNNGRLEANTGFNKFLTGRMVNAAGASLTCTQGNLYLCPAALPAWRHSPTTER